MLPSSGWEPGRGCGGGSRVGRVAGSWGCPDHSSRLFQCPQRLPLCDPHLQCLCQPRPLRPVPLLLHHQGAPAALPACPQVPHHQSRHLPVVLARCVGQGCCRGGGCSPESLGSPHAPFPSSPELQFPQRQHRSARACGHRGSGEVLPAGLGPWSVERGRTEATLTFLSPGPCQASELTAHLGRGGWPPDREKLGTGPRFGAGAAGRARESS